MANESRLRDYGETQNLINRLGMLALCLLTGCALNQTPPATPSPPPITEPDSAITTPPTTDSPAPDAEWSPDAGWSAVAPGMEQRLYVPDGNELGALLVVRVDPSRYEFRVHYRPGQPLSLRGWEDLLPSAALFVNANFFDENYNITGLLIQDGQVFGWPYTERGGLFGVRDDGGLVLRANRLTPYQTDEPLRHAVQAFPMLVIDGQPAPIFDQGRVSRRTVIGMDAEGRVLLMVTPLLGLSLGDLAAYLPRTDLGLVNAFALDGGRSTMMSAPAGGINVPPISRIPAVLAIYPR